MSNSPLYQAGFSKMALWLLDKSKATPNLPNKAGNIPLHLALLTPLMSRLKGGGGEEERIRERETVQYLASHGGDWGKENNEGKSPSDILVSNSHILYDLMVFLPKKRGSTVTARRAVMGANEMSGYVFEFFLRYFFDFFFFF